MTSGDPRERCFAESGAICSHLDPGTGVTGMLGEPREALETSSMGFDARAHASGDEQQKGRVGRDTCEYETRDGSVGGR